MKISTKKHSSPIKIPRRNPSQGSINIREYIKRNTRSQKCSPENNFEEAKSISGPLKDLLLGKETKKSPTPNFIKVKSNTKLRIRIQRNSSGKILTKQSLEEKLRSHSRKRINHSPSPKAESENSEKIHLQRYISSFFLKYLEPPPTTLEFYKIGRLIGKGTFGKVVLGVHKLSGKNVAIKAIDKAYLKHDNSRRKVFQEVKILKLISSEFVVKLLEVFESSKHFLIVMEYSGGGDLFSYIQQKGRLSEKEAKMLFKEILLGAKAIHSYKVLHRDFKLDNILLDSRHSRIKICDFGISRFVKTGEMINEECGTPAYLAPEIIAGRGYEGFSVDVWSLGIMLYALLCGTVPFKASSLTELHKVILEGNYKIPDYVSDEAKDLISLMIRIIPEHRINVNHALNHEWFNYKSEFEVRKTESQAIKMEVVEEIEKLGFPTAFVMNSLMNEQINHSTATYHLLSNCKV